MAVIFKKIRISAHGHMAKQFKYEPFLLDRLGTITASSTGTSSGSPIDTTLKSFSRFNFNSRSFTSRSNSSISKFLHFFQKKKEIIIKHHREKKIGIGIGIEIEIEIEIKINKLYLPFAFL